MKYAKFNDKRIEATKGAKGFCPGCGLELIPKCGEIQINHWSHKSKRHCDPWWENETIWHRMWKDYFPNDWQEVVHFDKTGEKHFADVKTESGWAIEFQHSYLKPEERRSRNTFYNKLVWVVNGTRRKTDKKQFEKILKEESSKIINNPPTIKVHYPKDCRLFNEWGNSKSLVFFDFNENKENEHTLLWLLYPHMKSDNIYLSYIDRNSFIQLSNSDGFDKLVRDVISPMHKEILPMYETNIKRSRPSGIPVFKRYMTKKRRR